MNKKEDEVATTLTIAGVLLENQKNKKKKQKQNKKNQNKNKETY